MKSFLPVLATSTFVGLALLCTSNVQAEGGIFAYPNAGQPQQQQDMDRFECHQWSVRETGFDPTTEVASAGPAYIDPPPPQQQYSQPQQQRSRGFLGIGDGGFIQGGGVVGDAATGAALGAAGGAIAGDAGQGALIGAGASALLGAITRSSQSQQQPQQQADPYAYERQEYAQAQYQHQREMQQRQERMETYRRAYGACMTARDYTVQ